MRGSGASIIQWSNFNYHIISTMESEVGRFYSDAEVGFFVERITQGCKLLTVYISRTKSLSGHHATSVQDRKCVEDVT